MFVKINQEAVRISKLLLLDLYDMVGIKHRGVEIVKRLSETPAFKSRIQTVGSGHQPISLVTFATTPIMTRLVDDGGLIAKWLPSRKPYAYLEEFCFTILSKYFGIISKVLSKEWKSPGRYAVSTNRGIRALLRLLGYVLDYSNGLRSEDLARKCLKPLKTFDFRESQLRGKYLGEGGADSFTDDLIRSIKRKFPDFGPQPKVVKEEVVHPGERLKAEAFLETTFKAFQGEVIGELKFVDKSTFNYLKDIPSECGIKLLVDGEKDLNHIQTLSQGRPYLEVRKIVYPNPSDPTKTRGFLHERWISDSTRHVEIGADLKSDALGNSQHRIRITEPAKFSPSHLTFQETWESSDTDLGEKYGTGTHSETLYKFP